MSCVKNSSESCCLTSRLMRRIERTPATGSMWKPACWSFSYAAGVYDTSAMNISGRPPSMSIISE